MRDMRGQVHATRHQAPWVGAAALILLLLTTGCRENTSRSAWLAPSTVETLASACAIAEMPDPALQRLCLQLAKGELSALDGFQLQAFEQEMHLTAYAAPALEARRQPTPRFRVPVRGLPRGYVSGDPLPTRREMLDSPGDMIVIGWVANPLDAYLAEVNGSVQLRFADQSIACLAWARTNDHPYTSLGRLLVERGHVAADEINLAAIRDMHAKDPELVENLMLENDRAVFFETIDCMDWPRASTGAVLRPGRSVAIDPEVIPLGSVLMLETTMADGTIFRQVVAAVDTGGAIIGNRIDLYLGVGPDALARAGQQNQSARIKRLVVRSAWKDSNTTPKPPFHVQE